MCYQQAAVSISICVLFGITAKKNTSNVMATSLKYTDILLDICCILYWYKYTVYHQKFVTVCCI